MAQSKQGQESPRGIWSCWVSPVACAFAPHLILYVHMALCSAFLFPESSALQLFPAVPGVRRAVKQRESAELGFLCSIVTGWGTNGVAQFITVVLMILQWYSWSVCGLTVSDWAAWLLCEACCGIGLLPVAMQSLSGHATTAWVPWSSFQRKPGWAVALSLLQAVGRSSWIPLFRHTLRANVVGIAWSLKSLAFRSHLFAPKQYLSLDTNTLFFCCRHLCSLGGGGKSSLGIATCCLLVLTTALYYGTYSCHIHEQSESRKMPFELPDHVKIVSSAHHSRSCK